LTSKDFRFKARVWYLQKTESVCTRCANGCNIDVYHRRGQMYRFRPRYNPDVNQYWMCDEGRLWYKELQKESRIMRPFIRGEQDFVAATWDRVVSGTVKTLTEVKEQHGANAVAGIVGAKATNEEAYLFTRLLKEQIGTDRVAGFSWSPEDAFHDNFLIKADKNPNTRGLQAFGLLNGGASVADILAAAEKGEIKALLVFAADLTTIFTQEKLDAALENVQVIVCDTDYTNMTTYADVIMPIGTATETDGTFTNFAGRVQRIHQAFPPPQQSKPGWEVLATLGGKLGGFEPTSISEAFVEAAKNAPAFAGLTYGKLGEQGAPLVGQA
jgi:NADH-quinone oxidoreductase subunit G